MTNKPTPEDVVRAMCAATDAAAKVEDLETPGEYAKSYGIAHKDEVNAVTVDAFMHGTAVVNLLVQECILRVMKGASETADEHPADKGLLIYAEGVSDGAKTIAKLMGMVCDSVIQEVIEDAAYERVFNSMVSDL